MLFQMPRTKSLDSLLTSLSGYSPSFSAKLLVPTSQYIHGLITSPHLSCYHLAQPSSLFGLLQETHHWSPPSKIPLLQKYSLTLKSESPFKNMNQISKSDNIIILFQVPVDAMGSGPFPFLHLSAPSLGSCPTGSLSSPQTFS